MWAVKRSTAGLKALPTSHTLPSAKVLDINVIFELISSRSYHLSVWWSAAVLLLTRVHPRPTKCWHSNIWLDVQWWKESFRCRLRAFPLQSFRWNKKNGCFLMRGTSSSSCEHLWRDSNSHTLLIYHCSSGGRSVLPLGSVRLGPNSWRPPKLRTEVAQYLGLQAKYPNSLLQKWPRNELLRNESLEPRRWRALLAQTCSATVNEKWSFYPSWSTKCRCWNLLLPCCTLAREKNTLGGNEVSGIINLL